MAMTRRHNMRALVAMAAAYALALQTILLAVGAPLDPGGTELAVSRFAPGLVPPMLRGPVRYPWDMPETAPALASDAAAGPHYATFPGPQ